MREPIPKLKSVEGWKHRILLPSDEQLVKINDLRPDRILVVPKYYERGIQGAIAGCYVREMIMNMLLLAANRLPKGYRLVIYDAWRPLEVQEALFNECKAYFRGEFKAMGEDKLHLYTQRYFSLPSSDETKPSPHNTGAAVDVTIMNDKGVILEMGTEFDETCSMSSTRYFEEKLEEGDIKDEEYPFLTNRRMLFHAMVSVGFTNYSEEWWHYDFGNQFWAEVKNEAAFYGRIAPNIKKKRG